MARSDALGTSLAKELLQKKHSVRSKKANFIFNIITLHHDNGTKLIVWQFMKEYQSRRDHEHLLTAALTRYDNKSFSHDRCQANVKW